MAFTLFGLTGGLASGKSTVAARFRHHGVPVIDADQLAREVVAPESEGLAAVVAAFGDAVLAVDGTLDRARMAALVFGDPARRATLNGLLHPRIGALTAQRAAALAAAGEPLACYEAALLVENGLAEVFRPLVVVSLPEPVQVSRAVSRDGGSEEQARARIGAQLPLANKVALADFVIDSSGSRDDTEAQADDVLTAIRAGLARR
ncbi:MAG: dephospho-CoA kinase [Polyangiaceae bacterium]